MDTVLPPVSKEAVGVSTDLAVDDLLRFDPMRGRRATRKGLKSFWTKQKDGSVYVTVKKNPQGKAVSVEVLDPVTHAVQHFGSLRQFWRSLGKTAPVSLRRYTGQEAGQRGRRDGSLLALLLDPAVEEGPKLGIDLVARGHEVKKLMWAGFGHKILRAGYDPDDVLQEIFRGIVARNHGTCPWDARKSSFGHYVHMVIGCVLTNYHRKQQQVRGTEVLGVRGVDGEVGDASGAAVAVEEVVDSGVMADMLAKVEERQRAKAAVVLGVLADGGSHREAMRSAKCKQAEFDALLAVLRG